MRLEKDLLATLEHSSQVTCLNLCSDNSQLVSGTRDGLVSRWCLLSHKVIRGGMRIFYETEKPDKTGFSEENQA